MRTSNTRRIGIGLLLLPALATITLGADRDMARFMPPETLLYLGWSTTTAPDDPELRMSKAIMPAVEALLADEDPDSIPFVRCIGECSALLANSNGGIGLIDVELAGEIPDVQLALVLDTHGRAAELAKQLHDLFTEAGYGEDIASKTLGGMKFAMLPCPEMPVALYWGVHDDLFIAAISENAAAAVAGRVRGEPGTLAGIDELRFDRKKVGADVTGDFCCFYIDFAGTIARARTLAAEVLGELPPLVDQALAESGLTAIVSKYVHYQEVAGRPHLASFAHIEGDRKGILSLWDQEPLTGEDIRIVPKDAYWAQITNLNLHKLWTESLRITEALDPNALPMVQGSLAMITPMLGFSITDELLPALGDTWAFYDAPSHGGLLFTGTVMTVDVVDQDVVHGAMTRVVQLIMPFAAQEDVVLQQKSLEHSGHTIHYVLIGGVPSPVAPAWMFVNDRWVFGLWPQTVAAAAQQVDLATRGPSLLDHPHVVEAKKYLPEHPFSVGYVDSQFVARLWYPFVNAVSTLGISVLGKHGVELDLAVLPPVNEYVAALQSYVGVTCPDKDGVIYSSYGDGGQLFVGAVGGAAMGTSIMLPSLMRARHLAKRAVSMANLRGIGLACHVYANDHDDVLPTSLDVLVQESMISHDQLESPLDPHDPEPYVLLVLGKPMSAIKMPSRTVLAYERPHTDEGTCVLFLDGHVEFMDLPAFRETVRGTYEKLGQPVPPEFAE